MKYDLFGKKGPAGWDHEPDEGWTRSIAGGGLVIVHLDEDWIEIRTPTGPDGYFAPSGGRAALVREIVKLGRRVNVALTPEDVVDIADRWQTRKAW